MTFLDLLLKEILVHVMNKFFPPVVKRVASIVGDSL